MACILFDVLLEEVWLHLQIAHKAVMDDYALDTYEYDDWGNILNKAKYAYTTGSLGTVLNTISYGYDNTQWGDQLTNYNGQTITYDSMGNMTSCGHISYTWDGKQLVDICIIGEGYYSYSYNEDGLRVGKRMYLPSLYFERNTEVFHVEDNKRSRWIQGEEWPMGANSPMKYLDRKTNREEVLLRFVDVDTGEKRIVSQFYRCSLDVLQANCRQGIPNKRIV